MMEVVPAQGQEDWREEVLARALEKSREEACLESLAREPLEFLELVIQVPLVLKQNNPLHPRSSDCFAPRSCPQNWD